MGPAAEEGAANGHIQPPATIQETMFEHYNFSSRQVDRDYYKEAQRGVAGNGSNSNRYVVQRGRHSIVVKDGDSIIFKIGKYGVGPRNLYLELNSCQYDVQSWHERRTNGEFGNWIYSAQTSPPL